MTPQGAQQPVDLDPTRSIEVDPDQIGAVTQDERQESRVIRHGDDLEKNVPCLAERGPSCFRDLSSGSMRWWAGKVSRTSTNWISVTA